MKNISYLFVLLSMSFAIHAQVNNNKLLETNDTLTKRNTIYFESSGEGGIYSINYDRLFRLNKKVKTSFTTGITFLPNTMYSNFLFCLPISYNFIFGKKKNHLELGTGLSFQAHPGTYTLDYEKQISFSHKTEYYTYLIPKIGYRYQKPTGGFFFRITYTPMIAFLRYVSSIVVNNEDGYNLKYFSNNRGFDKIFSPYAGISFGYTLKKKHSLFKRFF